MNLFFAILCEEEQIDPLYLNLEPERDRFAQGHPVNLLKFHSNDMSSGDIIFSLF